MATSTIKYASKIHYVPNDIVNVHDVFGYITNNNKDLTLFIPLGKCRPLSSGYEGVSINSSKFKLYIRRGDTTGGYVGGSDGVDVKSYLNSAGWWAGYIQLVFRRSSGSWGTNNTPVAGFVDGALKLG